VRAIRCFISNKAIALSRFLADIFVSLDSCSNVLAQRGPQYIFGTSDCVYGHEGNVNEMVSNRGCNMIVVLLSNVY